MSGTSRCQSTAHCVLLNNGDDDQRVDHPGGGHHSFWSYLNSSHHRARLLTRAHITFRNYLLLLHDWTARAIAEPARRKRKALCAALVVRTKSPLNGAAASMRLANPKSLIAGVLFLMMMLKNVFFPMRSRIDPLHIFTLIVGAWLFARCAWHAFNGRGPLLGKSEQQSSIVLGLVSLILGVGVTLAWLKHHHIAPQFLTAVVLFVASAFFFRQALRERRLSTG
jgi:hypothetical protein